jgi:hypothetical protein
MEELQKQVRRAGRRIALQQFVNALGWCWFSGLTIAALAMLVDKYYPLAVPFWAWPAGGVVFGTVAAVTWTLATRAQPLDAALEIDRRFGLKERVSSTLAMPPDDRESDAGQMVAEDAAHRVARLEISEKFPISTPRKLLLPLVPAALAFAVLLLPGPAVVENPAQGKTNEEASKPQVKKAAEALPKKATETREQAKKENMPELESLMAKIEETTRQMSSSPPDREKALTKLNELSKQLADRRKQVEGMEKIRDQLAQLKQKERGPADQMAQSLAQGDFEKALDDLKDIEKALKDDKLNEKDKEQLAKQLDDMKKNIEKMADQHKQQQAEMEKKIDELRKNGQNDAADKLQDQLAQMKNQNQQMDQLQDLAKKFGQCAECMKKGQGDKAADAMKQAQNAINDMKKQLDEMQMLDDAMDQLAQAKDQMNCKNCGGKGCKNCQGKGPGQGKDGKDGKLDELKMKGGGTGKGRAEGRRPESKTNTKSYESHVKQEVGRGSADFGGMVDGTNKPGNVSIEIQNQVDSVRRGDTDPGGARQLPRKYGEQVKEYNDDFRVGKPNP